MQEEINVVQLIADFGFPVVMLFGLGYFVYYVWNTINKIIEPAIDDMKTTIIRLTDQLRLLDQDMIRLKEKVDTFVKIKEDIVNEKTINAKRTRTRRNSKN
tara:strand:+ start:904 stop:1206 length:303 start_codon:yes stop_codon:yes gene_type:complete